jgi:osmoprotectant transport system substrate-binding protein
LKLVATVLMLAMILPTAMLFAQGNEEVSVSPQIEISGIDTSGTPTIRLSANVFSSSGQPAVGLEASDFVLSGSLAQFASVESVRNVSNDNLPLEIVLAIDTSSSMSGLPIEAAKDAARVFINSLRDRDQVAVVQFDTQARLVQDYTSDQNELLQTIDALSFGGETALYDAGVLSVEVAEAAVSPRRAVVLLSDGANFGEATTSLREDALQQARLAGVPVYTIGLGFGIDRSYLRELSTGTSARYYESPTSEELTGIYQAISELLRSQYILTLNADVPLDGTRYDFGLQATTTTGETNVATGTLRAPVPVPIVSISNLPESEILEPTILTADVQGDDAISEVTASIPGVSGAMVLSPPLYELAIDPADFSPGIYNLTLTATDEDGDAGGNIQSFEIGALPSNIIVNPSLEGVDLTDETTITVSATGQTETDRVVVTYGDESVAINERPFEFLIDPMLLESGEQTLTIEVTNIGDATSSLTENFMVTIPTIYVGSKAFTEAEILSWLVYLVLEDEGLRVAEDMQTASTTNAVREELLSGTIDVYVEYTATGVLLLAADNESIDNESAFDPNTAFTTVSIFDSANNDLIWLQPAPANNTYALAVTEDFATENEIDTLEDLALYINAGNEVRIAGNTEFFERSDAYPSFENTYDWEVSSDQVYNMGEEAQSTDTLTALETGDNGTNVAMAYTTDGELQVGSFVVLEDTLSAQPFYAPAPVFRGEVLRKYPQVAIRLRNVFEALDNRTLQDLNIAVTRFGDTPREAAMSFLVEIGELEAPTSSQ